MKYYTVQLIVFLFFVSSCASQDKKDTKPKDVDGINLVFKKYTDAIKTGQGNEALKYISQKTIDYYDSLIYHTLYSDEKELNKINILTRIAILRMRHTQSLTFWDTMTANKLLGQMWSKPQQHAASPQVNLVDCKIDKDKATCVLQLNGESTEMQSVFNKENSEWKIDITSTNSYGIEEMKNDIKKRGITETEYILLTIEELDNISVSKEDLYKPLKK
jgi:hypothetical protein